MAGQMLTHPEIIYRTEMAWQISTFIGEKIMVDST
jgi:hypothetical protein